MLRVEAGALDRGGTTSRPARALRLRAHTGGRSARRSTRAARPARRAVPAGRPQRADAPSLRGADEVQQPVAGRSSVGCLWSKTSASGMTSKMPPNEPIVAYRASSRLSGSRAPAVATRWQPRAILDHRRRPHDPAQGRSVSAWHGCAERALAHGAVPSPAMSRGAALSLYALLVLIWSSHLGRDQDRARGRARAARRGRSASPPPGVLLLGFRGARRRPLNTDRTLARHPRPAPVRVLLRPRLLGRAVHPVRADRGAVRRDAALHRRSSPRCCCRTSRCSARLLAGVALALAGLSLAFVESLELGSEERAALGAVAVVLSPLGAALGNIALKRRAAALDAIVLNGWGMLVGGALLLAGSAASEDWGDAVWSANALGSILYLAVVGSAVAFVVLTILLREMSAQASSFIALMIPFGALDLRRPALRRGDHRPRAWRAPRSWSPGCWPRAGGRPRAGAGRGAARGPRAGRGVSALAEQLDYLEATSPFYRERIRGAPRARRHPVHDQAGAAREPAATARRSASTCARRARTSCACT